MRRVWRTILAVALSATGARGVSNVDPAESTAVSAFIGAIDWRPNAEHGASVNQYYCSGFLHGAQVGWIQLGSAAPLDGLRYRNDSAEDFGVNVLPTGGLRGFAYGANIGWISFEERGNPRVDWATGKLLGSAYSANAGWIALDGAGASVRIENIGTPQDLDKDGLPDPWEIARAGSLASLSSAKDSDGDGQMDLEEFVAGTDPLDRSDRLGPLVIIDETLRWPSKAGHLYVVEKRASLEPGQGWRPLTAVPLMGTGLEMSFGVSNAAPAPGFFRVRAYPPLSKVN